MKSAADTTARSIQAAVLTWLLPGAGHYRLGHRGLAAVYFCAISFCYFTGVAVGGVKTSVNPLANHWLFLAEMGAGGYTGAFYLLNNAVGPSPAVFATNETMNRLPTDEITRYVSFYPESDVSQIYLAVAGLLNLLAIFDVLARAQTGGDPVFAHESAAAGRATGSVSAARGGP
jgi:hypothetical protein